MSLVRVRLANAQLTKERIMADDKTDNRVYVTTKAQVYAIGRDIEAAIERVEGAVSKRRPGDPRPIYRYNDGHSEAAIAAKHNVSEFAVANIRRELFGDLQRSDAGVSKPTLASIAADVARINEQLAEFARRLAAVEDAVTRPSSTGAALLPLYGQNGQNH